MSDDTPDNFSQMLIAQWASGKLVPLGFEILHQYGRRFDVKTPQPPRRMPMGECYTNAAELCLRGGLHYCEGYATPANINWPLPHAWCIDDDGRVVDPTWPDGGHYFGTVFSHGGLGRILRQTGVHGVYENLHILGRKLGVDGVRAMLVGAIDTCMNKETVA